jgi:carbamoyl-phosphate synthase large subunit
VIGGEAGATESPRADGEKTVLVTGIGGHVGQGILRNLRTLKPRLRLVGTDVGPSTAGHYYCDSFRQVPYAYDAAFPEAMRTICGEQEVDLIVPATDYEAYHLALMRDQLPPLVGSPAPFAKTCLDKYETHRAFRERGIPFVDTVLPSRYRGDWDAIVVKPREGRGSRDVHLSPADWRQFDDSFIVQRRLYGPELTTAFYVSTNGALVGHITFERTLHAGFTLRANVTQAHDAPVSALIDGVIRSFDVRGPCNIQSIATPKGPIPFELNSRYSAIAAFSSQFGFEDVHYGVEDVLFDISPATPTIRRGGVHRILLDIVYRDQDLDRIASGPEGAYIFV